MLRGSMLALLMLPGCALVFPLRSDQPPETPTVSGRVIDLRVVTAATGEQLTEEQPVTDVGGSVAFDDGSSVQLTIDEQGRFVFDRATQHYRIQLVRGPDLFELHDEVPELVIGYSHVGRDAAPPPSAPKILLPVSAGANVTFATTGQWSRTDQPGDQLSWGTIANFEGRALGLFSSTAGDRAYYLEYGQDALQQGQRALHRVTEFDPLEMTTDIETVVFQGPPRDVVSGDANRCVRLLTTVPDLADDFTATLALPDAWSSTFAEASLRAVPVATVSTEGFVLATEDAVAVPAQTDLVAFDPFDQHEVVAVASVGALRQYVHPEGGEMPFEQFGGIELTQLVTTPDADCAQNPVTIDRPIALPHDLELGGEPLVFDNSQRSIPRPGLLPLTWEVTPGEVDYFEVILFELRGAIVDGLQATQLDLLQRYRTRVPRIDIDTEPFKFGRYYGFLILPFYGAPEVANGDYAHLSIPSGVAVHPSAMFQAL